VTLGRNMLVVGKTVVPQTHKVAASLNGSCLAWVFHFRGAGAYSNQSGLAWREGLNDQRCRHRSRPNGHELEVTKLDLAGNSRRHWARRAAESHVCLPCLRTGGLFSCRSWQLASCDVVEHLSAHDSALPIRVPLGGARLAERPVHRSCSSIGRCFGRRSRAPQASFRPLHLRHLENMFLRDRRAQRTRLP